MEIVQPGLQGQHRVRQLIGGDAGELFNADGGLICRDRNLADMPFEFREFSQIGYTLGGWAGREKFGETLSIFGDTWPRRRVFADIVPGSLGDERRSDQLYCCGKLFQERRDETGCVVPSMDLKSFLGIPSPRQQRRDI